MTYSVDAASTNNKGHPFGWPFLLVACEDENPRSGFDKRAAGERRTLERSDDGPDQREGRGPKGRAFPPTHLAAPYPPFTILRSSERERRRSRPQGGTRLEEPSIPAAAVLNRGRTAIK